MVWWQYAGRGCGVVVVVMCGCGSDVAVVVMLFDGGVAVLMVWLSCFGCSVVVVVMCGGEVEMWWSL